MVLRFSKNPSIVYHNIFNYKLTKKELVRWQYKGIVEKIKETKNKNRLQREKYSQVKFKIAKKAARIISKIPTVKFVGVTGALAMMNASKNSDIDLMIITSQGMLWFTRLVILVILVILSIPFRRFGKNDEKDKLCLNMWLDESDLVWKKNDRNIYTAHEIAQIVPLVNKDKIYEKFLWKNKWILDFWPNAVTVHSTKYTVHRKRINLLEKFAFNIQYLYMKNKITREIVTPTRAIFHPNDWGKVVLTKLSSVSPK